MEPIKVIEILNTKTTILTLFSLVNRISHKNSSVIHSSTFIEGISVQLLLLESCDFKRSSQKDFAEKDLNKWLECTALIEKAGKFNAPRKLRCLQKHPLLIKSAMTPEFGCLTDPGAANLCGPAKVSGVASRSNCSPVKAKHSESCLRGLAYFL